MTVTKVHLQQCGKDGNDANTGHHQGHVNNVTYFRYAESARVNWINNFAIHVDPANGKDWLSLMSPHGIGLIMGNLQCDFKLVRFPSIR
jgi:hypothetical protein